MTAQNAPMSAEVLAVPISVGRQEVQNTHPALPTFYQTRINFGGPENPGNTVALVFGNNSTSASEQLAFAEKLVLCYNQGAAVSAMAEREAALVARLKALESEVSARRSGWASFVDDEDPSLLVVAHHDRSVHFTGASAWDDANAFDATRTEPRHA